MIRAGRRGLMSGFGMVIADRFLAASNGTVTAPAYGFLSDTDNGLILGTTNRVEMVAGGGERQYWSASLNYSYSTLTCANQLNATTIIQPTSGAVANKPRTTQSITAVGNSFASPDRVVQFDADGSYTLTSAPTLADGTYDGQICMLLNVDTGADVVTVQDQGSLASSNLRLTAASRAIGPRDSLVLMWTTAIGDWVEVGFTNVI